MTMWASLQIYTAFMHHSFSPLDNSWLIENTTLHSYQLTHGIFILEHSIDIEWEQLAFDDAVSYIRWCKSKLRLRELDHQPSDEDFSFYKRSDTDQRATEDATCWKVLRKIVFVCAQISTV